MRTERDLLSRILYGARVSRVGVLANLLAVTLGTLIGAIAAFCATLLNPSDGVSPKSCSHSRCSCLQWRSSRFLKPSFWIIIMVIGLVYWTWMRA